MDADKIRQTLAEQIALRRKAADLTQEALAQKLNYSDKSVSKWERAEGVPDVQVLAQLTEIFGCTADELLGLSTTTPPETPSSQDAPRRATETKRVMIPLLSMLLAWLTAAVGYFVLELLRVSAFPTWLVFIYAIPASCIVLTVFARLWHGCALQAAAVSGVVWGTALSLKLSFPLRAFNLLFIVAAILQLLTVLWFVMRGLTKKKK